MAEKLDYCRLLEIPLYVVFASYHVATEIYRPPFARAYILQESGEYKIREIRKITISPSGEFVSDALIDISGIVPFRLGLQKRKQKHQEDEPLYRLVLIDPEKKAILLTRNQKNERIIDEQNQKINEQNQKISKQNKKIEQLDDEIQELKKKFDKINKEG